MRQCDECGEANHDDARYCGTCGAAMSTSGSIESLVADDGERTDSGSDDATPVGLGLGAAAPVPPDDVDATTVQDTVGLDSETDLGPVLVPVGAPVVRSLRSASATIAVLAVAAVVIIGGVFVLLASGPGTVQTARTGEDAAATVEVPAPASTATTEPAPPSTPPTEPTPPSTPPTEPAPPSTPPTEPAPASTAPTAPAATEPAATAPAPSTDAPPPTTEAPSVTPAPTAAPEPEPTTPPRGPGDLGLTQPILDEECDGRYITFVGAAVGDRAYDAVVDSLLDLYPEARYIWTRACPSLRQELDSGADIYGVVYGPFETRQEACDARETGPEGAYVRRISTTDPQDHTVDC